ncbi:hypothetical protein PAMA_004204 [Pampus argenteus]
MEHPETVVASPRLPLHEDMSQSAGQTINQLGTQSHHSGSQDQRQSRMTTVGWELQQPAGNSLQLEFQDSNLSPALSLLPINSGVEHSSSEYSLFQQSEMEFAPLRAYPDISMASERFHFPPQDCTTQASDRGSLSQHPLAQATILSEEGASSIFTLSQLSLSPQDKEEMGHSPLITTVNDRQWVPFRDDAVSKEKDSETLTDPPDKPVGEAPGDDTFFLSKDVPAQQLLEILQRDVGMPSCSSSAVSSTSETSVKIAASFGRETKTNKVSKTTIDLGTVRREGPPGEASLPQQQTQKPDQAETRLSEVCNITMGSRSTQPDESSEVLHRELLSETERGNSHEAQFKGQPLKTAALHGKSLTQTPYPTEMSEAKPSGIRTNMGNVPWTGAFSTGVERGHRGQDLWSSGNQTGIDGSYLGFLPQSQSTPGIFKAPHKSSVKATPGQLYTIESNKESLYQSSTGISSQPVVPVADTPPASTADQCQDETTSAKVQSLPCLNYMQKVDAWRENQGSGKTSLFDSLALQGFSGISPKKKAYDAISDSLNRILSQQARSLHQPPASSAANQNVTQSSSTVQSGSSSPRRGEAVGSAPTDRDNTGSAAQPSASPFGRSQSHSSVSTVMSVQKDHQTERAAGKEKSQTPDNVGQQPSATVQTLPPVNLGQFSDVSLDTDLMLSSSQDSCNSGIKLGTSIGASSVVSLEVDNYAPYWTSKLSTPPPPLPKPRELNIEERIPLYLHNLGIDQSPSTILTPFVPRGPIREPEFSPTDLCTIKGSIGTPTKSTQPSEVGSPHKGEFSRCSILSVDSSVSIPFSLDSLGLAASIPEKTRASPSSHTAALQSNHRLAQSDEDSLSSTLQTSQQRQRDSSLTSSQNTIQLGARFDSDLSLATKATSVDRDLESPLQAICGTEQSAEDSFVSAKALREIRKLLSQAENVVSGCSAASSTPAVPRLLSDDDIFLSLRKKTGRVQDFSFSSSSTAGEPRTQSPLLWARSASDSMLTSEKPRESSIGRERMTLSGQPGYSSTKAVIAAPGAETRIMPQNSSGGGAGSSQVLSKSARRTEPEGCSAAPPDNAVPIQPPVIKPSPAVSTQQSSSTPSTPSDTVSTPEKENLATQGGPVESGSSSPILEDTDQGVMSDGSSESSLAVRVAKLLQSESPSTMVSSTPSLTDQEESKAREWIKLKISGQQCEPLELDIEDRKRIEEIKRELLLKKPIESQGSTDTESTTASSQREQELPRPTETFVTFTDAKKQASEQLQCLSIISSNSRVQFQNPPPPDLEARVREIAAREGVTLPRTNAQAFTSITIATRKRSTSPSPSTSPVPALSPTPEPLHLTELSTEAVKHPVGRKFPPTLDEADKTIRIPATFEPSSSLYTRKQNLTTHSAPVIQKRQDAVGGQYEEPPSATLGLDREDVNVRGDNTQSFKQNDELSIQDSSISGVAAEQTTISSTVESPERTGHVSHVHLTLSPKATDHSVATAVHDSTHVNARLGLPQKEFVPLRHSPIATSSPDEGVGLCSPPEWYEIREPIGALRPERADTSTLFKPVSHKRTTSSSTQSLSPKSLTTETPVPVLLPYKPRGSEELFYVPQTKADVSSTNPSDTTMESSHTGSDDAVPPPFSSEVLGHQDPGLDRGVTIRHTEGIYSKRLKTATFKMQERRHRDGSSQTSVIAPTKPPSQVSVAFTRVPLSSNQVDSSTTRDRGTSPVQFLNYDQPETRGVTFQAAHVEMDHSKTSHHWGQRSVPQTGAEQDQERSDSDLHQQSSSTLDQLWRSFCERWSVEESRPTSDREASLLERLERLSRLIHSTRDTNTSELQMEAYRHPEQKQGRRGQEPTLISKKRQDIGELRRSVCGESREVEGHASRNVRHQAWTQRWQVEETPQPTEEDSCASHTSSFSHKSSQSQHLCPADRDESESVSTVSGSMSTVDTARLIRAFGVHRVQHVKTSSSLSKLYSTIDKQKEGREQRKGRNKNPPHIFTPIETNGTDDSTVAADSSSSTSTYTFPSHHGPSMSLAAKKTVKLVNKGIQAGDLEIVSNGTRRHTRDVGTIFPSPGEATAYRQISSSSSSTERGRREQRSPSNKTPGSQKQRKTKRSPSKLYPEGVTWFISANDLRAEARKENRPEEEESSWRPSTAWFEPHSRIPPWREPLRQRHVHEYTNKPPAFTHHAESSSHPTSKITSSGLTRITLQEALEMRRPEFISRSMQRVKRLTLQVEERKLQTFSRERNQLVDWSSGQERLLKPAGTALIRRAVPRKEMIQRSKQIYDNLPEVQRKKEEERRKAEYQSYRLNAQLYNKRITNHVLGRRTAWQ